MFENYPLLQDSIVFQALRAMVFEKYVSGKNPAIDPKLMSFYRYLRALNPKACEAVAGNLVESPSISCMKVLNARERVSCILECDVQQMTARILEAMRRRQVNGQRQAVSLAIDATKCS